MAESVLPDPKIPLTPGQVVCLGGLLGYSIRNVSDVNKSIADYGVSIIYYRGKTAFINNDPTYVTEDPKVVELFDVVGKEATLVWLRPKPGSIGKFSVVGVIPPQKREFRKFMSNVKFGLFVRPVTRDKYAAILKMGEGCDKELYAHVLAKRIKKEKELEMLVRDILGLPSESEIIKSEMKVLRESLKEMIKEIVAKTMEELAEQMFMLMRESRPPRGRRIPYGKITTELLKLLGVYKVDWSGDVAIVYCSKKAIDEVKKKIVELGGEIIDEYESRFLAIIKADFGGGK